MEEFPTPIQARNALALATRYAQTAEDEARIVEMRRLLAASHIAAAIKSRLAAAPPLTDAQTSRLIALLRGGAR